MSIWREFVEVMAVDAVRQWLLLERAFEAGLKDRGGPSLRGNKRVRGFLWAKARRFDTNEGDACGCCKHLEGAIVVTFIVLGLRMKTLDLAASIAMARAQLPT
jgi:hypothetical protein